MKEQQPMLLVDDDTTDAILFKRAISNLKITNPVVHLTTCREGLDYLKNPDNKKPWIAITDFNTPDMNGLEFLEAVKTDEALKHIVVIVLSGSDNEGDVAESYILGAAGYMVKPSDHKKLVEMISAVYTYWTLNELPPQGKNLNGMSQSCCDEESLGTNRLIV